MARFLVLGTGFVAEPVIEYLSRKEQNKLTVVGITKEDSIKICQHYASVTPLQADVSNKREMLALIKDHDIVISLVPASLHDDIATLCIAQKTHMVTASYQTPKMKSFNQAAKQAGIIILNEIGLDPGIDHLSAMQIIDDVHDKGGEVEAFSSWCGGIPAPDSNNNPIGYKFSWAPKGALLALLNDAVYLQDKKVIKVSSDALMQWTKPMKINGLDLEGYPNRESICYKEIYGINSAKSIIRGTLRYQGFSQIMQFAKNLGLLNPNKSHTQNEITWINYIAQINSNRALKDIIKNHSPTAYDAIKWLGCFSETKIVELKESPLDTFCHLLLEKLSYQKDEQDMVLLQHKFVIKNADKTRSYKTSYLQIIGDNKGFSAMAKTVGLPIAMASELILTNKIQQKGVLLPMSKIIYQPLLSLLKQENIAFTEQQYTDKEFSSNSFSNEIFE